jgi:lysophospholipase
VKSGAEMKVQWNHIREMPPSDKKFSVQKTMNPNVGVLKLFPGITQATIQNFLKPPLQGCVMETYGSGNAPDNREDFLAALKEATDRGVIIVNVTQCNKGMVQDISVYGTGAALQKIGIVNGADMTTEAALTKLSYNRLLIRTLFSVCFERRRG